MNLDYRPSLPADYHPGVGIVGCGGIVKLAHLPAYADYGVNVVGVYDPDPEAVRDVRERVRVFESLDELLADPGIELVDIATHPSVRPELVRSALRAGKHVLSQKPFALDLRTARELVEEADRQGVTLAVNQNGRWAPPWRVATLLVRQGAVGAVVAVTHLHDKYLPPLVGTPFDKLEHFLIYDYSIHWIDITRCWLEDKTVTTVRAVDYRTPGQPPEAKSGWGAWIAIEFDDGTSAMIRSAGNASTARPAAPFWIHGTEGTIRGSVLLGSDFVELDRDGRLTRYVLEGGWYNDGFAGTMGELQSAIAERREPSNSGRDNLLTLHMTLAACRSADEGGRPISLDEIPC